MRVRLEVQISNQAGGIFAGQQTGGVLNQPTVSSITVGLDGIRYQFIPCFIPPGQRSLGHPTAGDGIGLGGTPSKS